MEATMATAEDAKLILKLYDLRREETLRQARRWITTEFNPQSFEEFMYPLKSWGSDQNAWFRQVTSYWEMAAALVLHGTLNGDLFLDCNGEPFFIYAKCRPYLAEVRKAHPNFLKHTEQLIEQYPAAQERVDAIAKMLEGMRAEAAAKG